MSEQECNYLEACCILGNETAIGDNKVINKFKPLMCHNFTFFFLLLFFLIKVLQTYMFCINNL